jgi:hypothetical protein
VFKQVAQQQEQKTEQQKPSYQQCYALIFHIHISMLDRKARVPSQTRHYANSADEQKQQNRWGPSPNGVS